MLAADTLLNNRYRIEEPIGEGGMATVYRAVDARLGRSVAVKVLHPEFARDRPFLQRFQQEAEFAASLGAHPNIVDIYDIGQDDHLHYIIMEYVEGPTLKDLIHQKHRFEAPEAFAIGQQVASALAFAHKRGLIHRDVKPQNILVAPDGQAKVTDFGIARGTAASQLTRTGMVIGTVHYFSPEQARGEALSPASDIYSLGIILFEMLTGHLPFDAENAIGVAMQHVHSEPPSPWDYNPDLPARAVATVLRALEKDPGARYRDALEFASALGSQSGTADLSGTMVSPLIERPRERTATYEALPARPVPPAPVEPGQRREERSARPVAAVIEPPARRYRPALLALGALLLVAAIGAASFFTASQLLGGSSTPSPTPTRTPTPKPSPTHRPKKPTPRPTATIAIFVPPATNVPPPPAPTRTPLPPKPTATLRPRPTAPPPTYTPVSETPTIQPFGPTATATNTG